MTLTLGTAPFGQRPAGVFNFERGGPAHVLYFEASPRRVRGILAGETVLDSRRVKLLHETGHLPVWYFPEEDVRMDLLERTDRSTHCPFKGDASYWSVRVGDRVAENATWGYPHPMDGAPPIAGHLAFYWESLDRWLEEDEEVAIHPRDPYHRVDVLETSRHVRVSLEGEVLAESRRSHVLFETGLSPRYYLPAEDVRTDALEPAELITGCPYKGEATYWSMRTSSGSEDFLAWTYEEPRREIAPVAGLVCFFNERVDLEVDGELQERPKTPWSSSDWARTT